MTDHPVAPSRSAAWTLAAVAVVVAALYLARDVLIPLALAALLSFLLAPIAVRLRRVGLGRYPSVLVTVVLAFALLAAASYLVTAQVVDLAHRLPQYQLNIDQKLRSLSVSPGSPTDRFIQMLREFSHEFSTPAASPPPAAAPTPGGAGPVNRFSNATPVPVQIVEPPVTPLGLLTHVISTAFGPIAEAGMVIIFVIFMLGTREDLRDRVIRLMGTRKLSLTTHALNDAAERVSRYLAMQLLVNTGVATVVGVGLWLIGVPNPLLGALLVLALRFVPYVGVWIAAAFPMLLALAAAPGWAMLLQVFGLFALAELITANFVEPLLYGVSTGVSSLAILASAVFWTWLWGPIGLLLATPLTVCLVVIGRHVPALEFFSIALGDEPVLPPAVRYYQRMLAMDADEPAEQAREYLAQHSVQELFDDVLLPALALAEEDRHHQSLDPERQVFLVEHTRRLIEDVADQPDPRPRPAPRFGASLARRITAKAAAVIEPEPQPVALVPADAAPAVVCVPVHDAADHLAALMLSILLRRRGVAALALDTGKLLGEWLEELGTLSPRVACISAVPPYAMSHTRYAAKRIRSKLPGLRIMAGFWDSRADAAELESRLKEAGADSVATTLKQAAATMLTLTELTERPAEHPPPRGESPLPGREEAAPREIAERQTPPEMPPRRRTTG